MKLHKSRPGQLIGAVAALLCLAPPTIPRATAKAAPAGPPAPPWRAVASGLAVMELDVPGTNGGGFHLHCFKVNLAHYTVAALDARERGKRRVAPIKTLAQEAGAHLAINGTFFDRRQRPLGLLVGSGERKNPLRRADWGVLFVAGSKARLVHTREWRERWDQRQDVTFAIQVGPRLVEGGTPLQLKKQSARRGLIGILPSGELLVAVNDATAAEANDLAAVVAAPPERGGLGCTDAMMVDGGPSAQLFAQAPGFQLHVPGGWGVPNGVGFVPQKK